MLKSGRAVLALLLIMITTLVFTGGCLFGITPTPTSTSTSRDAIGEAWDIILENYVDQSKIDSANISQGAIEGMLEALDDPYSSYLDAETYQLAQSFLGGSYDGIGAYVTIKEDKITIIAPIAGSPADKAGVKLMVAHSRRFFPLVKQAKRLLDEGAIGRILMLRQLFSHNARSFGTKEGHWMSDPRLSMGFFLGYGCHQLDMTLHLVGSKVRTVIARFGNYWADSPIENCGALFLDFESGAYSTFMEICSMPNELKAWPPFPDYHEVNEIFGERGLMHLRPYGKLAVRNGKDGDDWKTIAELPPREADVPTTFLREEVEALADAVANDTEPPVTAAEGRHCVEIIQAAYESSKTGKAVYLPL